jgi:hypothetical protein
MSEIGSTDLRMPQKPFKVYEVEQPGDVKGTLVGEGPDAPTAIQIMCSYWLAVQQVNPRTGYVVACWDESAGAPGTVVSFIGAYDTGQYPAS